MAIVIEEKRNQGGLTAFLIWLVVLGVVAATVYFVFFKNPGLVEFTGSSSFKNVQQLSKISIKPDQLLNNPRFQALKQYVTVSPPQNPGRSNPFLGF